MVESNLLSYVLKLPEIPKIRPMRSDEWATFHQLDAEIFLKDDQMGEESFLKRVQKPGFLAIETKQSHLAGYLILGQFTDEIGHLGRIGVNKALQSQGLGSQLMTYALNWFQQKEHVKEVQLYTQIDNIHAQGLYKKFRFKVIGQTWHYFIPFASLKSTGTFSLQIAKPSEYQHIANLYPHSPPLGALHQFLERKQFIYTLKNQSNKIVGACRFNPGFPGCFPFELNDVSGFDDYALGFQPLCEPPSDFLRITFHENEPLVQLCETREYRLHHTLFRMQLILKK